VSLTDITFLHRTPVPPRPDSSFGYVIDDARRMVVVKPGKHVTVEAIREYADRLRAHPSFEPSFSEIADLTDVEEFVLQGDDFLRLADQIDPFSLESRRAFVVRTATQSHAARMHKILRTQRNFEIFKSFDDAERWIRSS
jgi:hypothetical protein